MAIVRFRRPINGVVDSVYIKNINETKFENCEGAFEIEFLSSTHEITNTSLSVGLPNLETIIFTDGNRIVGPKVFVNLKRLRTVVINCLLIYINLDNFINCYTNLITEQSKIIGFMSIFEIDTLCLSKINYQNFKNKSENELEPKFIFSRKNSEHDLTPIPIFDCSKIKSFVPVGGVMQSPLHMCAVYGYIPVMNIPITQYRLVRPIVQTQTPQFVRIMDHFRTIFQPTNLKLSVKDLEEKKPKLTSEQNERTEKHETKKLEQNEQVKQSDVSKRIDDTNDSSSTTFDDTDSLESSYETETLTFINGKLVPNQDN